MNAPAYDAAVAALRRGGIVAYPTEAVYGLGCDPANATAIARLLELKQRPASKGLILIAADEAALQPWLAPIDAATAARIRPTWPGAATWLLPAADDCPPILRGEHETLAVRVTAHPVAAGLCRAWGGALVSTSANRSGGEPVRDAGAARDLFGAEVDAVVEGAVGGRERPTPIRDARTGQTLRE
ncbi:MAG: Sua5/YciO/YrdC/YwlC family protein [Halofilum sp. (in: g-proteobacteria)]|nr:Sua5/YciO/YrdC/YwlC family protein [Halofilum sp. (in: g-proteobacteria)]